MPKWVWDVMLMIFMKASPEIKNVVCSKLDELEAKAKETKSPWDDMLVKMLKGMAGCPSN